MVQYFRPLGNKLCDTNSQITEPGGFQKQELFALQSTSQDPTCRIQCPPNEQLILEEQSHGSRHHFLASEV